MEVKATIESIIDQINNIQLNIQNLKKFGIDVHAAEQHLKMLIEEMQYLLESENQKNNFVNSDVTDFSFIEREDGLLLHKYIGFGTEKLYIPNEYNGKKIIGIDSAAFYNLQDLTTVNIADGIKFIGAQAFKKCSRLSNVNLPQELMLIENEAFMGCPIEEVKIPDSCLYIGCKAFAGSKIQTLFLPQNMQVLGFGAFALCNHLQTVYFSDSMRIIGNDSFAHCTKLQEIHLNCGLTQIGNEAFLNCSTLREIDIPESVTFIGEKAFQSRRICRPDLRYNPWYAYDNLKICIKCTSGSEAQSYARANSFKLEKSSRIYQYIKPIRKYNVFECTVWQDNHTVTPIEIENVWINKVSNDGLVGTYQILDDNDYNMQTNIKKNTSTHVFHILTQTIANLDPMISIKYHSFLCYKKY